MYPLIVSNSVFKSRKDKAVIVYKVNAGAVSVVIHNPPQKKTSMSL